MNHITKILWALRIQFLCFRAARWTAALLGLSILAPPARAQLAPGSLNVRWNAGAENCAASTQPPLQVHAYEPQTSVLRQDLCAHFEGNFLYLLIGSERALLIDTGAVADPARMPLAKTVLERLPAAGGSRMPLLVVHTHGHEDHRAGDAQFAGLPSVQVVSADLGSVRTYFHFDAWPDGEAHIDLGNRIIDVIPAPGHHPSHVVFYDRRTGLLFSGDFLLPGRLIIGDLAAYKLSAARVAAFVKKNAVSHILGAHIELDADGNTYSYASQFHPREHRLELSSEDLFALPAALESFNGFYAGHGNFVLSNPIHNLIALALAGVVLLILLVFALRRYLRRRRKRRESATS